MKPTIAQFLKVKDFPFVINDKNGNEIYYERSTGFWSKREYNAQGDQIYYEDSTGYIFDKRPRVIEMTLQQVADKLGMDVKNIRIKD